MTSTRFELDEIFVIDRLLAIPETLAAALRSHGHPIVRFADGMALMAEVKRRKPAAVVLDIDVLGVAGMTTLEALHSRGYPGPIFMMSEHPDIKIIVEAMKCGAFDFIQKPLSKTEVADCIIGAITVSTSRPAYCRSANPTMHFPGHPRLTVRETDVLDALIRGATNKAAASELGISSRTVEFHRAHIMAKFRAKTTGDLMRIVMTDGRKSARAT